MTRFLWHSPAFAPAGAARAVARRGPDLREAGCNHIEVAGVDRVPRDGARWLRLGEGNAAGVAGTDSGADSLDALEHYPRTCSWSDQSTRSVVVSTLRNL
jgi:hypothetical protein